MKALITGASSGIGRDIARVLAEKGCELVLSARREERLLELKKELSVPCKIVCADLSKKEDIFSLYEKTKELDIDILINNAGYGVFGEFNATELSSEMEMIDVNIKAMHSLLKLFLSDFIKKDKGYILNVASSAAFLPGPLFSSYYASKAYVLRLSEAVYEELLHEKSNVSISVLCPGPVSTEFDKVANVDFSIKSLSSEYVAKYAVKKMFAKKLVIVPGGIMKAARFFSKLLPDKLLLKFGYMTQSAKLGK